MEDLIQSMSQQFGTIVALTHDKNAQVFPIHYSLFHQVFIQFETHQAASNCAQYWNNRQYNNHTIAAHLEGEKEWQGILAWLFILRYSTKHNHSRTTIYNYFSVHLLQLCESILYKLFLCSATYRLHNSRIRSSIQLLQLL